MNGSLIPFLRRLRRDKSEGPGEKAGTEARSVGLHQPHPVQEKPGTGLPLSATICPLCKGERGYWQHFVMPDEAGLGLNHVGVETCFCGPRFDPCLACHGSGEIVGIARATLLARGDIAPVQRRGYA